VRAVDLTHGVRIALTKACAEVLFLHQADATSALVRR
jgi:hypothetical protein